MQLSEQLLAAECCEQHLVVGLPLMQALPVVDEVIINPLSGKEKNDGSVELGLAACEYVGREPEIHP